MTEPTLADVVTDPVAVAPTSTDLAAAELPSVDDPAVTPWPSGGLVGALHALDEQLYARIAVTQTPRLDAALRRLSHAANYSRLWIGCGVGLALLGGPRGRRAAAAGLASVAVTSAAVNTIGKLTTNRPRPDRARLGVVEGRWVSMPTSSSFPSGHSASAFAFAEGVRTAWPAASAPLFAAAALVAYSRVHTGVHYPGDVLVGSGVGLGLGRLVGPVAQRVLRTARWS